jgi:uncharacterized protein (DUF924 family)
VGDGVSARARAVLAFWFGTPPYAPRKVWFERDPSFDRACAGFAEDQVRAAAGDYDDWAVTAEGALALVLLLDQFPRNLFRGTPAAYTCDAKARAVAKGAVTVGQDAQLSPVQRVFLYLPFEHSEALADQDESCRLFAGLTAHPEHARLVRYAERHREIVARFGRFPHRNEILGRATTPAEEAFLQEPDSSF